MSWMTVLGFVAIVLAALFAPEIARLLARCTRPRRAASGARSGCTSHRAPRYSDPMFWIGHGGSVKRWD